MEKTCSILTYAYYNFQLVFYTQYHQLYIMSQFIFHFEKSLGEAHSWVKWTDYIMPT